MKKSLSLRTGLVLFVAVCGLAACSRPLENVVIPRPAVVQKTSGDLHLRFPLSLRVDAPDSTAAALSAYLQTTAFDCRTDDAAAKNFLHLELAPDDGLLPASAEGYELEIAPKGITVRSRGEAGLFYGIQTLLQLHSYYGDKLPAQRVMDSPRFAYRGLHLDESRHFFGEEHVRKQLRMMAALKLNRLHWHLTDGAGWRIAIDRYPLLTSVAAWRQGATWQQWWDGDRHYCRREDEGAYGGYYTKAQLRAMVAYADSLHITIVPEIEMPGHSEEVLAVYPELSCSGKPYANGDFCIGNELTFEFLENVLTEVMELFPSEYIHIGGDEASKAAWRTCPKCQARMRKEGLKDVDELQSYAIHRIERFLNVHGRKLMGWDEILEGGVAPGAAVMSWRGEEGGRIAAASGHPVVMTPGRYCYFDGYQDNPTTEPMAMSGYLPLSRVYEYDPAPLDMPGRECVMGVQANLWAEYIPTAEHAEYMLYPRLFALSEVAWSYPEEKDFADFRRRALRFVEQAEQAGYHPFDLSQEQGERPESLDTLRHLAYGCKVHYAQPWREQYAAGGDGALTDGVRGSWSYGDRWQGFLNSDVDVTLDLGAVKSFTEVAADFIQWSAAWVWLPVKVEISVSDDGLDFCPLATIDNDVDAEERRPVFRTFGWKGEKMARYIRLKAIHGEHDGGWLFTDEIIVR